MANKLINYDFNCNNNTFSTRDVCSGNYAAELLVIVTN